MPAGSHKTRLTALNVCFLNKSSSIYSVLFDVANLAEQYFYGYFNRFLLWVCFTQFFWFQMCILHHLVLGWYCLSSSTSLHMKKLVVTSDTILIVYFTRFHDYEDMLEDTWHMEFPRRSDISDGLYPSMNVGLPMWDSYPVFSARPKKEEKVGLAEAITSSILSTGRFAYISPTISSK